MSRFDFMRELEGLLSTIPFEERIEALKYYNDYFDDAGAENEDKIINELGTPERVAAIIKADLQSEGGNRQDRGFFTEKGYEDTIYEEKKFEVIRPAEGEQKERTGEEGGNYNNKDAGSKNSTNIILIILICIFALPVGIPLVFSVFGVVVAIIAVVFALLFGFGIAGIVMVPVGIALMVFGLVRMGLPVLGLSLFGSGLIVMGLGILFVMLSAWLCKTVLPAVVRGVVYICRLPFKNRSVSV